MKNLTILSFAFFLLTFVSCTKEGIMLEDKDPDNATPIMDAVPEEVEAVFEIENGNANGEFNMDGNNPPSVALKSATEFLATESDLSVFHQALVKSGLDVQISGTGPYTVFAPNNAAFNEFLENNNYNSIDDVPTNTLSAVVKFHISLTEVTVEDLTTDTAVPIMFNNFNLYIHTTSSPAYITLGLTQADLLSSDIKVSNGNINKIDAVLSL